MDQSTKRDRALQDSVANDLFCRACEKHSLNFVEDSERCVSPIPAAAMGDIEMVCACDLEVLQQVVKSQNECVPSAVHHHSQAGTQVLHKTNAERTSNGHTPDEHSTELARGYSDSCVPRSAGEIWARTPAPM